MSFINIENINKSFGTQQVLTNINIQISKGHIFGLLGPNGAGKTTLLRIINQIFNPDSGKITINDNPIKPDDIYRIGYLPEERGLYKKMKVGEQALYLAQLKGLSKSEAINRLKVLFEKLEVTGWWDKKIEELSKGMAQKVQFITTIVHEPEILIFDEPFSGFDPINANMLKNEILELKSKGATIIFSTHNMASVEELCDEIALINKSKVILDGSVHEIKNKYKKGLFEVHFQGEAEKINNALNNDFNILNLEPFHNGYKAIIKAEADISDNHLLKKIINEVHITNYQEILPSMDEIFISVVQGKDKI